MIQKYYYQKGMCIALGYNSLNPVIYTSSGGKEDFQKNHMTCYAVADGRCKCANTCQLLQDAPEKLPYYCSDLRDKKLG